MNKPLDRAVIAKAMERSVEIAAHGTPEQRAGMFRPTPSEQQPKPRQRRAG